MNDVPIPENMKRFPLWHGYPVHFTVWVKDGVPDFKMMHEPRRVECFNKNLCHLCGKRMSAPYALIGGPLCVEAMRFIDGPMHPECAIYAAKVCPFLSSPTGRYKADQPILNDNNTVTYEFVSNVRPAKMALCLVPSYRTERNPPTNRQVGTHAANPHGPNQLVVVVREYISVDWTIMPQSKEG